MRASAEAELENTKNSIAFSESELTEAKHRLQQLGSKLNETALQEVDDINIELPEVKQRIRTLEHRLAQLTIKATFAGEVNGLELKAGSVIAPGEKLMEIIPKGSDLLVVAQVNTKEIGHLSVGDPVKIKVMTYDYARYGSIDGTLQKISAGTFKNEEGFPFCIFRLFRQAIPVVSARSFRSYSPGHSGAIRQDYLTVFLLTQVLYFPLSFFSS